MAHLCYSYALQLALQMQASAKLDGSGLAFVQRLHVMQQSTASWRHGDDDSDLAQFALELFDFADQEEMAGNATRQTARNFYTCRLLMDVLQLFGPLPQAQQVRRKYAQWRANTITKAVLISPALPPYRGWSAYYENLEVENIRAQQQDLKVASKHLFENLVTEHE
eukprot:g4832.t1